MQRHPDSTFRRRGHFLFAVAGAALSAMVAAQPLIVFESERDGDSEIYVANADGTGAVNLTQSTATLDQQARWSPDGSLIAFIRDNDLWLMNPDGSEQTELQNAPLVINYPAWSPDGSAIYYSSGGTIFSIPIAGGSSRGPSVVLADDGSNKEPSPTPDGLSMIYTRSIDGDVEIWSYRFSDGHKVQLTDATNRSQGPIVSPDGERIAFYSNRSGQWSTWVMDVDGSDQTLAWANSRPSSWSSSVGRILADPYPSFSRVASFDEQGNDFEWVTDGVATDRRADPRRVLFSDGFESGDTQAWN